MYEHLSRSKREVYPVRGKSPLATADSNRGFIALISAVVISAVLLLIVVSSGLLSINSRSNILDSELKERSDSTADACADEALYQLALDASYPGGTYSLNSLDKCTVGKITNPAGNTQFEVQATSSNNSVTSLKVVANSGDLSIISWEEIPAY